MNQAELTILIHPDGKVEMAVTGVQGPSCTLLTRGLTGRLGKVTKQELTDEAYQGAQVTRATTRQSG